MTMSIVYTAVLGIDFIIAEFSECAKLNVAGRKTKNWKGQIIIMELKIRR